MFPMRLKIGPPRNNEWRCCFCLHVRTATTLLGIWQLMLHVLALSVLALLMRNHHMQLERTAMSDHVDPSNLLPTPLSKIKNEDNPYFLPKTQDVTPIYSSDMDMSALMTVCTLALTLLLVFGSVKGKPNHLLPFFCLQLFDFAITTLTATGYFCYLRSVHNFVNEHWNNLPYRQELLQLSPQCLSLIVVAAFFFSMLWKAYCISIVWRCYKYLQFRQQVAQTTVHYILPGEVGAEGRVPNPDYSSLLPDYDAACASAMKQPPPPSYQAAMEAQPPSYPDTVTIVNLMPQAEEIPPYGLAISHNADSSASDAATSSTVATSAVEDLKDEASGVSVTAASIDESAAKNETVAKPAEVEKKHE